MITALAHALVLTLDGERRILTDGGVAFDEGGEIVAVGPSEELLAGLDAGARVIDCAGRVVAPGFVDAHVHLGEGIMRGLVPDAAGPREWLPQWLLPCYAALTEDEERIASELTIAEMLLTGTTTFCEAGTLMHWPSTAEAVEKTGIRAQLGRWLWDLRPEPRAMRASRERALAAGRELLDGVRARGCPRLSGALILLGIGTASEGLLRDGAALAREAGAIKAMMHAASAPEHGGEAPPVDALAGWGWVDERTKLTHVVYVDDGEVAQLARGGVRVAHCPTAALRHIKGISRHGKVPEMLAAGMTVGLGGDSANGSNHFNMLRLAYLAATLYKDFRMDQTLIAPETALEMATLHGARCLGLEDEVGSLEVGKRADIVVFSTEHPEWRPLLHPVQNLVLGASDRSIESVWVDGRELVRDGELQTIDLPALLARADQAAAGLLERVGMAAPWEWPRR